MKKYFNYRKTLLALAFCFTAAATAQIPVWHPDNGDGTFTNPLLWGDWPDPDLIRVGNDFYMVSTSMHYVPGCPILHSKDLINWDMAGYAIERYDEDPRYDLNGGNLYLNGSWAASIRHHNGKFYVAFCTPYGWGREKGNFSMCIADHPEGPWERVIFPEYMYDPGLLFDDDGKSTSCTDKAHSILRNSTPMPAPSSRLHGKYGAADSKTHTNWEADSAWKGRMPTKSTGNTTSPALRVDLKAGKSVCAPTAYTAPMNTGSSSTTAFPTRPTDCTRAAWCS